MIQLPLPASDTVNLHVADLERSAARLEPSFACLSGEERARADRFVDAANGRRFSLARAFLRMTLARYTFQDPGDIAFCFGLQGKPSLVDPEAVNGPPRLFFNLSHSRNMCAIAVATGFDVGVDVEFCRDFRPGLAERFFSEQEVAALNRLGNAQRFDAFFRCWTRKEAVVKALGDGLTRRLKSFDVSIDDVPEPKLLRLEGASTVELSTQWTLFSFRAVPGTWGAIACRAHLPGVARLSRVEDVVPSET